MIAFPRLASIVAQAILGDVQGVLKALALRQDYNDNRKHKMAVEAVQWLGDNPKKTLGEANLVGQTKAGELPVTPDVLAQAIIELARKNNANS